MDFAPKEITSKSMAVPWPFAVYLFAAPMRLPIAIWDSETGESPNECSISE